MPWITMSMIAICVIAFGGYHLDPTKDELLHYLHWGFVPPMELRSGMI